GAESRGTAGQLPGLSDPGPSCPGQPVAPACPRNRARVTRDSWSTPQAVGAWPKLPGTAIRPRGTSGPGPSRPCNLVNPAGTRTWARFARDSWSMRDPGPET
ncbi:hypothetical protein C0215_20070, partial [Clostridioides difficile]